MDQKYLAALLEKHKAGEVATEEALAELTRLPFENLDYAKLDHHRALRTGYPEVIYGEGKTPAQAAGIFARLAERNPYVLCTRAGADLAAAISEAVPGAIHHQGCRVVEYRREPVNPVGLVAIVCAGTSDLPVAEEAAVVASAFGSRVERVFDVGVAGIHRLLAHVPNLRAASAVVVVAGMEGALPSVVAGLVHRPIIAVPTSVGYGASFGGLAALLAMLNSCANGVSVVNIDNGFGAAVQADMINKLVVAGLKGEES